MRRVNTQAPRRRRKRVARRDPNSQERTTDFQNVTFTTKAVVGLVLFTASLVAGQQISSNSLRGDIQRIEAKIDAKETIEARDELARQREAAAEKKIVDDRAAAIEKNVERIEREYKLRDFEITAQLERKTP